jgi:hypothetical protein
MTLDRVRMETVLLCIIKLIEPIITNYIIDPKYEMFIIYNVISEIGMLGRKI